LNSQRGPFYDWVHREAGSLVTTTYVEGSAPGALVNGARHEDLQALTFADESFDLFLNQEIFEHVVDDARAFREAHRVLRPGGFLVFTVPLEPARATTLERARMEGGAVVHLTEPEYHDEPSGGRILAFRSYGADVVDRLRAAGFARAWIEDARTPLGSLSVGRPVVVAHKT
jgi:SAM-dependent methyltransferase